MVRKWARRSGSWAAVRQAPPRRSRRGLGIALGAVAAGVLLAASFPPFDLVPLVFVGLLPLYVAAFGRAGDGGAAGRVRDRVPAPTARRRPRFPRANRTFAAGYLCGAVFYALHLHWLLKLDKEEVTIPWIMVPALGLLAAYFGLFVGGPMLAAGWLRRRTGISPALALPVFWTVGDWLRTLGETAFSWGSLGYALAPWPAAIQGVAWAGFWVLPGWIVLVNGLLWEAVSGRRRPLAALSAAFLVALPLLIGGAIVRQAPESVWVAGSEDTVVSAWDDANSGGPPPAAADTAAAAGDRAPTLEGDPRSEPSRSGDEPPPRLHPGTVRFGVLQANTPREIKWRSDYRDVVVADLVAKSRAIADAHAPDVIVWPETAAPLRVMFEAPLRELVTTAAAAIGHWMLVGTLDAAKVEGVWEHYNSAILFSPDGVAVQRYHKRRMVPFGELTPFKDVVPVLAKINFGQSEFTRGREPGLFPIPDVGNLSCLICFESTFPVLAREDVAAGAEFLVNVTNDFWFGPGAGPIQHQRFAILRAVETRTPLVRCANTGVSCVIDPYGRVIAPTALFETVLRSYDVLPGRGGGFHARTGDWILGVWFVLAMLLGAAGLRGRRGSSAVPNSGRSG